MSERYGFRYSYQVTSQFNSDKRETLASDLTFQEASEMMKKLAAIEASKCDMWVMRASDTSVKITNGSGTFIFEAN